MTALGSYLVIDEEPFHADAVVALAGDFYGNRILRAAELVKQGWAPRVLVSGPSGLYGRDESDLAIQFAVSRGYPREWFEGVSHQGDSTREEAAAIRNTLEREHVQRFLLVTSNYHCRRAARVWRRRAPGLEFRVVAADDRYFHPDSWWKTRPGRKAFLNEWMRTVADWLGV